jgi:mannose PTS system EIIA component
MFKTLVVTQGALASELVSAGSKIAGEVPRCQAVSLGWEDDLAEARSKVALAIEEPRQSGGVLVLVDMVGSTPYRAAVALAEPGRVEVVTGVNLAMVMRLGCPGAQEKGVAEAAEWLKVKGQGSIVHAPAGCAPEPVVDMCAEPVGAGRR